MKQDPGLWKIAPPENQPHIETAGLDKDESDFVSKYLSLADQLLKSEPAENPASPEPIPIDRAKPVTAPEERPEKPARHKSAA